MLVKLEQGITGYHGKVKHLTENYSIGNLKKMGNSKDEFIDWNDNLVSALVAA